MIWLGFAPGIRLALCAVFVFLRLVLSFLVLSCPLLAPLLARFGFPTWLPKSTKIDEKSMPRCLPMLTSFFDRFFIDFCSQLGPPEPPKSLKLYWFYKHFWLCGIFNIRSNFDPILVPTWLQFCQNPPKPFQKTIPRCIKSLIDFCIDFFSILAPSRDPSWGHVGHILF